MSEASTPASTQTTISEVGAASSTKELTAEGAKVITVAEGTNATAAAPEEPTSQKITFAYFPIVGRGLQVHILAKEHGVELDVKVAKPFGDDFDKDTEAMFGTVPWMKDGALELNDSMAMVQYLVNKYKGPATPATPEKQALAGNMWGWCQDYYGFVASPLHDIILGHSEPHWRNSRLTDTLAEGGGGDEGKQAAVAKLKALHDRRVGYLEAQLVKMGSPQFLTGDDYTYADIFLFTNVRAAQKCKGMQVLRDACGGDPFAACPTILAICDRVGEREAVKAACGDIFDKAPV